MTTKPAFGRKRRKTLLLVLLLVSSAFSTLMQVPQVKASEVDFYIKNYNWSYRGIEWSLKTSIPRLLYDAYRQVSVSIRVRNGPAGYGFLTTTEDPFIKDLTEELNITLADEGYNEYEKVSCILAFVQSLPYTSDSSSSAYDEYPRFPAETLVDDGGDCEDTSILFATIMLILGYGVIYINPPEHIAVGVLGESDLPGTYWTFDGKPYYYCETTGENFEIGELPENLESQTARLYPIDLSSQFVPDYVTPLPTSTPRSTSPLSTSIVTSPSESITPFTADPPTVSPQANEPYLELETFMLLLLIAVGVGVTLAVALGAYFAARSSSKTVFPSPPPGPNDVTSPSEPAPITVCPLCGELNPGSADFCNKCENRMV